LPEIQTERKNRLPSGFSYPVTAAALSQSLADIPQKHLIKVSYGFYTPMTIARQKRAKFGLKERIALGDKRLVLEAKYERLSIENGTPNSWLADESRMNRYSSDGWTLTVYAIPTIEIESVRDELDSEGFAKLTEWFLRTNERAGSIGIHAMQITFDGTALAYREWDKA
jgi:hypothetical protein